MCCTYRGCDQYALRVLYKNPLFLLPSAASVHRESAVLATEASTVWLMNTGKFKGGLTYSGIKCSLFSSLFYIGLVVLRALRLFIWYVLYMIRCGFMPLNRIIMCFTAKRHIGSPGFRVLCSQEYCLVWSINIRRYKYGLTTSQLLVHPGFFFDYFNWTYNPRLIALIYTYRYQSRMPEAELHARVTVMVCTVGDINWICLK